MLRPVGRGAAVLMAKHFAPQRCREVVVRSFGGRTDCGGRLRGSVDNRLSGLRHVLPDCYFGANSSNHLYTIGAFAAV